MPRKVAVSNLQASTVDILNVIRANASAAYQANVPSITTATEVPKVGEAIFGYPGLANEFLSALMNRIAMVQIKSAHFNNKFADLKKGYIANGETIEEVFVNIAKIKAFSTEKAADRELKRSLPDVKTAFHACSYKTVIPITVEDVNLRQAFLSAEGVTDMISELVDSVYRTNEYAEWLLFKYLIIKSVAHGGMVPKAIDTTNMNTAAVAFREVANQMEFMHKEYNPAGVMTATPKEDQVIIMDANMDARFDVEVLSAAFNMDKAEYLSKRYLMDDWSSFDNETFAIIRQESDQLEEVTAEELALMAKVKAVVVDKDFFQIYDNLLQMEEMRVTSGMYTNYFLHSWKTVSPSPFANAIVFVDNTATIEHPASIDVEITGISDSEAGKVLTFAVDDNNATLQNMELRFIQTQALTTAGVAVYPYGAMIVPGSVQTVIVEAELPDGTKYNKDGTTNKITMSTVKAGDVITLSK